MPGDSEFPWARHQWFQLPYRLTREHMQTFTVHTGIRPLTLRRALSDRGVHFRLTAAEERDRTWTPISPSTDGTLRPVQCTCLRIGDLSIGSHVSLVSLQTAGIHRGDSG